MVMSFVGSAAPIAAFVAITRRRAGRACTAEHSDSGRSAAEDGGPAAFLSREECRDGSGRGRKPRAAVADPPRLPSDRPLEGRGAAVPPRAHARSDARSAPMLPSRAVSRHEASHVLRCEQLAQRCTERVDAEIAQVVVEVAELWRQHDGSIPALRARASRLSVAAPPAGSASRAM